MSQSFSTARILEAGHLITIFRLGPRSSYLNLFYIESYVSSGPIYEGWNFNSGNYLFTTDTK